MGFLNNAISSYAIKDGGTGAAPQKIASPLSLGGGSWFNRLLANQAIRQGTPAITPQSGGFSGVFNQIQPYLQGQAQHAQYNTQPVQKGLGQIVSQATQGIQPNTLQSQGFMTHLLGAQNVSYAGAQNPQAVIQGMSPLVDQGFFGNIMPNAYGIAKQYRG